MAVSQKCTNDDEMDCLLTIINQNLKIPRGWYLFPVDVRSVGGIEVYYEGSE